MLFSYPISRAEDLYQALRFGKTFTKLDLTKAYLQRRPSGVPSALAIFQNVMDTMLAGIANVAAYLDDIILTGETDDGHWRTLKRSGIWVTFSVQSVSEETQRRRQLLLICSCPRSFRNCGLFSVCATTALSLLQNWQRCVAP
ncbi:Uncharacterized protein T4B_8272 [Trichinella pseudospiralis]|uniref:Reverse transcriptase domain-containing protein n=1 Tax=Trichinella pseudospiralis TaxID=6337 RepID=A0A0V1GQY5_TRIPS|nr:Uncharacterized protein T4B_8272 [Trichinella pseudospiralis]